MCRAYPQGRAGQTCLTIRRSNITVGMWSLHRDWTDEYDAQQYATCQKTAEYAWVTTYSFWGNSYFQRVMVCQVPVTLGFLYRFGWIDISFALKRRNGVERVSYPAHRYPTPMLTLPKTLCRQGSLSLVLVGFPVTFASFSCSVVSPLFLYFLIILLCMLCKDQPSILWFVPFLSPTAIICPCHCCFLVMLSACCSLLVIRLSFLL